MAQKSTIYNMYNDLVTAVRNVIEKKYIFLKDRPTNVNEESPMEKFVVIDLPVTISDYVIGNRKTYLTTSGVMYLFVQARSNSSLDVNSMGDFVDSIVDLFPIKGKYVTAVKPVVRLSGSDGHGFQVAVVYFDLRSKWGALSKK